MEKHTALAKTWAIVWVYSVSGPAYCKLACDTIYTFPSRGVRSERRQLVGCEGSGRLGLVG